MTFWEKEFTPPQSPSEVISKEGASAPVCSGRADRDWRLHPEKQAGLGGEIPEGHPRQRDSDRVQGGRVGLRVGPGSRHAPVTACGSVLEPRSISTMLPGCAVERVWV